MPLCDLIRNVYGAVTREDATQAVEGAIIRRPDKLLEPCVPIPGHREGSIEMRVVRGREAFAVLDPLQLRFDRVFKNRDHLQIVFEETLHAVQLPRGFQKVLREPRDRDKLRPAHLHDRLDANQLVWHRRMKWVVHDVAAVRSVGLNPIGYVWVVLLVVLVHESNAADAVTIVAAPGLRLHAGYRRRRPVRRFRNARVLESRAHRWRPLATNDLVLIGSIADVAIAVVLVSGHGALRSRQGVHTHHLPWLVLHPPALQVDVVVVVVIRQVEGAMVVQAKVDTPVLILHAFPHGLHQRRRQDHVDVGVVCPAQEGRTVAGQKHRLIVRLVAVGVQRADEGEGAVRVVTHCDARHAQRRLATFYDHPHDVLAAVRVVDDLRPHGREVLPRAKDHVGDVGVVQLDALEPPSQEIRSGARDDASAALRRSGQGVVLAIPVVPPSFGEAIGEGGPSIALIRRRCRTIVKRLGHRSTPRKRHVPSEEAAGKASRMSSEGFPVHVGAERDVAVAVEWREGGVLGLVPDPPRHM
eukprot:scaffold2224_cov261-Pinguiococcus_pyrenoidosus.AAC.10